MCVDPTNCGGFCYECASWQPPPPTLAEAVEVIEALLTLVGPTVVSGNAKAAREFLKRAKGRHGG